MELDQELSQIEQTLWTNDVEVYRKIFVPDAVVIFPEVGRVNLEFALTALREENAAGRRWAEVIFQDVRALAEAPDVALLHYAATARWNYKNEPEKSPCATLYVMRDGAWRVAFHHQTVA